MYMRSIPFHCLYIFFMFKISAALKPLHVTKLGIGTRTSLPKPQTNVMSTAQCLVTRNVYTRKLSSVRHDKENLPIDTVPSFAIVGGGLAGLSIVWHLLQKLSSPCRITIFDHASGPGQNGASAVAGGLIHPLSPRGKLVHWGLEGLDATVRLIEQSVAAAPDLPIQLRQELYRVAMDEEQIQMLQRTAQELPNITEWIDHEATLDKIIEKECADNPSVQGKRILGALRLHSGCQVIHVPSYLQGLLKACENNAISTNSKVEWKQLNTSATELSLEVYDATIYCAGAGMLHRNTFGQVVFSMPHKTVSTAVFPVQLVRGQSIRLTSPYNWSVKQALLCGKYVSPTPHPNHVLVGATHEFKTSPLDREEVISELRQRTASLLPWNEVNMESITLTSGVRVQSERGRTGRRPIVGRLSEKEWIFTGLSSRGLLYHALYGDILIDAVVLDCEEHMLKRCSDILWWKIRK